MVCKVQTRVLALVSLLSWWADVGVFGFLSDSTVTLQFDAKGVCTSPRYFVNGHDLFTMRNVPGDGDCMFLAVALGAAIRNVKGLPPSVLSTTTPPLDDLDALETVAKQTRMAVSRILQSSGTLVIDKNQRHVPAKALLAKAAADEGVSIDNYLTRLETIGRLGGLYGGGPELAVLSNLLQRPISIYEFAKPAGDAPPKGGVPSDYECPIECQGTFGCFDDPLPQGSGASLPAGLHVLVINASPRVKHACILLPEHLTKTTPSSVDR